MQEAQTHDDDDNVLVVALEAMVSVAYDKVEEGCDEEDACDDMVDSNVEVEGCGFSFF